MSDARRGGWHPSCLIAAIVIPWRDEGDRGASLRYALRSLAANLPHGEVVVVGDKLPDWSRGVKNIVLPRKTNRYDDGQANVLAGLEVIGEWAYITHDDMIVLRPVDYLAPTNRGLLSDYKRGGDYYQRAARVKVWLQARGIKNPVNFNVHAPFLVHAPRYLEHAAQAASLPAGFRASIYGNLVGLRTKRVTDPKVVATGSKPHPSWLVASMSDRSFKQGYIGKLVRQTFRQPSPYEE